MTVGQLVESMVGPGSGPRSFTVERTTKTLPPNGPLAQVDLRSGDIVWVVAVGSDTVVQALPGQSGESPNPGGVVLRMISGPQAGVAHSLPTGSTTLGRLSSNDVAIIDPGISRRHATFEVDGTTVTVTDNGSTNGIGVEGKRITGPTTVRPGQRIQLGASWAVIERTDSAPTTPGGWQLITPTPRSTDRFTGEVHHLAAPVSDDEGRRRSDLLGGRGRRRLLGQLEGEVVSLVTRLDESRRAEREARLQESPSIADVIGGSLTGARRWERRAGEPDALTVRFGLAEMPSRSRIEVPPGSLPEAAAHGDRLQRLYAMVDGVPATVDLARSGGLTVRGPIGAARELAYGVVAQLAGLLRPEDLGLAHWGSAVEAWDWLKWLPHLDRSVPDPSAPGLGPSSPAAWLGQLLDGVVAPTEGRIATPLKVVVVDGVGDGTADSAFDQQARMLLGRLLAEGPAQGLYPLIIEDLQAAEGGAALPAARAVVTTGGRTGMLAVDHRTVADPIALEPLDLDTAGSLARTLAPFVTQPPPERSGPIGLRVSPLRLAWSPTGTGDPGAVADGGVAGVVAPSEPSLGPGVRAVADASVVEDPAAAPTGLAPVQVAPADADRLPVVPPGPDSLDGPVADQGLVNGWAPPDPSTKAPENGDAPPDRLGFDHGPSPAGPVPERPVDGHDPATTTGQVPVGDAAPESASGQDDADHGDPGEPAGGSNGPVSGEHEVASESAVVGSGGIDTGVWAVHRNGSPAPDTSQAPADVIIDDHPPGEAEATPGDPAEPVRLASRDGADVPDTSSDQDDSGGQNAGVGTGGAAFDPAPADTHTDVRAASHAEVPEPVWLDDLPRSDDDARLVLGTVHLPDRSTQAVFAFNADRDGSMGLVGRTGTGKSEALRTVLAAAGLLDVADDQQPRRYLLVGPDATLADAGLPEDDPPTVVVGPEPDALDATMAELSRLLDDRLATFELAEVDDLAAYRTLRPDVALPRVIVAVDDLAELVAGLPESAAERAHHVIGQLLEIGPGLGLHLVFSVAERDHLDALLVDKVGRWLDLDRGTSGPGSAQVGVAQVRFAVADLELSAT
jgi:pSer/pThr/pTyr-binding forkhead associated (FHA) protein